MAVIKQITNLLRREAWRETLVRSVEAGCATAVWVGLCGSAVLVVMLISPAGLGRILKILKISEMSGITRVFAAMAIMAVSATLAAVMQLVRRVKPAEAALLLDLKYNLQDRLITAAELARSKRADEPVTQYVSSQAIAEFRRAASLEKPRQLWFRTRRPLAASALVAILFAILAILPSAADPRVAQAQAQARIDAVTTEVHRLTPNQYNRIVNFLNRDSHLFSATHLNKFAQLQQAFTQSDIAELTKLIRELTRAGYDLSKIFAPAPNILRAAGGDDLNNLNRGSHQFSDKKIGDCPYLKKSKDAEYVHVYDPAYAKKPADSQVNDRISTAAESGLVDFDSAWSAARRQAESNLAAGNNKLPHHYRELIRDYFSPDCEKYKKREK